MSSIAKSSISISKKDLTKSRIPPVASRNVVFYHKATAGDLSINLLSLTMPSSEIPTAVQASVDEISGAKLYVNKKNLKLVSSSKGELIQGMDYIVIDSYTIILQEPVFTGGAEPDEIFIGTINSAPISDLVVASAKTVTKTYELAVGSTVLNLGREYEVGVNPNDDVGIVKIYVNGVLVQRDVDYVEIDSGSGYGTTIQFTVAPAINPYIVTADFGVMAITDNNAIGSIENLAGSIKKIADDLAVVAGTSANDYYNASPSEVERRTFGDWVLKMLDVEVPIVTGTVNYSPTLNWTNTDGIIFYYRSGNVMIIEGTISITGTPVQTGTQLEIPLPSGLSFDSAVDWTGSELGHAWFFDTSLNTNNRGGYVRYATPTTFTLRVYEATATTPTFPITFATGDRIFFQAQFPIEGWSAKQKIRDIIGI